MGCMTRSDCAFVLENDCTLFGPLVTYLLDEIAPNGALRRDRSVRGLAWPWKKPFPTRCFTATSRSGPNLREEDDKTYYALIEQRRLETPYRDRRVHVEAELSREWVRVVVRDEGPGFDPSTLPDPTDPANLEKVSGRGVLLMRTFMDEVIYSDSGDAVTLIKHRNCC